MSSLREQKEKTDMIMARERADTARIINEELRSSFYELATTISTRLRRAKLRDEKARADEFIRGLGRMEDWGIHCTVEELVQIERTCGAFVDWAIELRADRSKAVLRLTQAYQQQGLNLAQAHRKALRIVKDASPSGWYRLTP